MLISGFFGGHYRRRRLLFVCAILMPAWSALAVSTTAHTLPPTVIDVTLGTSAQGRPISALRVGDGPRKLVLVGAVHGGPERNTYQLATELATHFRSQPTAVPDGVRLYIIPTLNPDGLALGIRQNANGVDLNRNMDTSADGCPENDWNHQVEGAYGIVSDTGGPYSESEVESRLIRDFLLDANGVIFFHTSGGVVFPACGSPSSDALGRVFSQGASYSFIPKWNLYQITGGMHDWAGGLGIAAITPELLTPDQPETTQNLAGVMAVLNMANEILPEPVTRTEGAWAVQPIIWRAWKAWGGTSLFGLPLAPAVQSGNTWSQTFERAVFTYRPDQSDTTGIVQIEALGREQLGSRTVAPALPIEGARFFPETKHNVTGALAAFWQTNGGIPLFGLPLTEEEPAIDERGQPVVRQVFERVVLERPTDASGSVVLAPLGRMRQAQESARSFQSSFRPR